MEPTTILYYDGQRCQSFYCVINYLITLSSYTALPLKSKTPQCTSVHELKVLKRKANQRSDLEPSYVRLSAQAPYVEFTILLSRQIG